jgi:hypothetical protein
MSSVEVGGHFGKNELSIYSTVLNSVYLEHSWFFLHSGLLESIDLWIPVVYCIKKHSRN